MPKNDFWKGVAGFGEGFLTTLQSERDRKRNELEFNQKMGLEDRQMRLMDKVRQQDFLLRQQNQAMDKEKTEFDITSGYTKNTDSLSSVGELGSNLNKQFNGAFSPFEENQRYTPNTKQAIPPNYELKSLKENGKDMQYWVNPKDPNAPKIPFGEQYHQPQKDTVVKIDMPKPEKWKAFGNLITDAKETQFTDKNGETVDKSEQERNQAWNQAKNNFYSNLNPNAYLFYKNKIKKTGKEKVDNATYLKIVRDGVNNGTLDVEDAQDLIDASAYRSDLFGAQ